MEIVNRTVLLFYFVSELIERKLKSLSIIETVLVALEFLEIAFMLIRRTLRTCQLINPDYLNAEAVRTALSVGLRYDMPAGEALRVLLPDCGRNNLPLPYSAAAHQD